jgi:hypothetical protein
MIIRCLQYKILYFAAARRLPGTGGGAEYMIVFLVCIDGVAFRFTLTVCVDLLLVYIILACCLQARLSSFANNYSITHP